MRNKLANRIKERGVIGDDCLDVQFASFEHHLFSQVDRQQNSFAWRLRITQQESDIVPLRSECRGSDPCKRFDKIADFSGSP